MLVTATLEIFRFEDPILGAEAFEYKEGVFYPIVVMLYCTPVLGKSEWAAAAYSL